MTAYYNEIDPYAAGELRKLIGTGRIAPGDVDERSIADVRPDDLRRYTQAHFFAGIGGWSIALRLAGWADDRPVWTGSCPCQPFSAAGKRLGFDDERHLWPEWYRLICEHTPPIIFGEQTPNAPQWVSLVQDDLERCGYAFATRKLYASEFGARHRRRRLWFVADAQGISQREQTEKADAFATDWQARPLTHGNGEPLADTNGQSPLGSAISWPERHPWRSEPAVGRVVDGVSHRLVEPALRALGNAIVPQVAAEFIAASVEAIG